MDLNDIIPEIRNKLQASKTILEIFNAGKIVPKEMLEVALKDLETIEAILNNNEHKRFPTRVQQAAKEFLMKAASDPELARQFNIAMLPARMLYYRKLQKRASKHRE